MKEMTKTRADFEPEVTIPKSIEEIVRNELYYDNAHRDHKVYPKVEPIEELLQRVYQHIEKEALSTYHSNEPWALRQWALTHILKDEVVNEATAEMAHGLISPVIDWQEEQPFDPIAYFSDQLIRKSPRTIKGYLLTASRFIGFIGRKRHYTDEDIRSYLKHMDKIFNNNNTYNQECVRLLQFLRRLPGANEYRKLPIDKPKVPKKKTYVHAFTFDELETLCWASVIDNIHYRMVLRLIAATIYGRRVGELTEFQVHLDGANSTVLFPIRKGGEEVAHPIPENLVPLFSVPIDHISEYCLQRWFRQICKRAQISLPYRGGFHSIRRRVATIVKKCLRSDIDTHKFMRWAEPRELSILAQYDQTRYEEVDKLALENHPVVKIWEQVIPYLLEMNTSYKGMFYDNAH